MARLSQVFGFDAFLLAGFVAFEADFLAFEADFLAGFDGFVDAGTTVYRHKEPLC